MKKLTAFVLLSMITSVSTFAQFECSKLKFDSIPNGNFYEAKWADFDGDGDFDLAFNKGSSNEGYIICIYERSSDSLKLVFAEEVTAYKPIEWIDIDSDQLLDIVINGQQVIKNNNNSFKKLEIVTQNYYANSSILVDVNYDGKEEILLGQIRGELIIGNIIDSTFSESDTPFMARRTDWTFLDGNLAFVYFGGTNGSAVYDYDNQSTLKSLLEGYEGETLFLDYDNDGDQDVLLRTLSTVDSLRFDLQRFFYLYENNNNQFTLSKVNKNNIGGEPNTTYVIDIDADGTKELMVNGYGILEINDSIEFKTGDFAFNLGFQWGYNLLDYNNDNQPDLYYNVNNICINQSTNNTMPSPPTELNFAIVNDSTINLSWNEGTDLETPSIGLTYNYRLIKDGDFINTGYALNNGQRTKFNKGNLDYINERKFINLEDGFYTFQIQSIDGGFASSSFKEINFSMPAGIVGITKSETNKTIVYPNPTYNQLHILSDKKGTLELYNELGEFILSTTNLETVDISSLTEGLYIYKLKTENQIFTGTVIKAN